MSKDDAIVRTVKGKNSPQLGTCAVMVSSEADLRMLCTKMNLQESRFIKLFMSKLYVDDGQTENFALVGPFIGAPYAAMILETLIAWGTRKILFFGWCGAISHDVKIGDIIIPTGAIVDEGTSRHYGKDNGSLARPSDYISRNIKQALRENGLPFHEGLIWSIDAVYRETHEKMEHFQKKDALAVEMELSAIFSVGRFREVEVGGVLVVSDEISTGKHTAGFSKQCFKKSRRDVCKTLSSLYLKNTIQVDRLKAEDC